MVGTRGDGVGTGTKQGIGSILLCGFYLYLIYCVIN